MGRTDDHSKWASRQEWCPSHDGGAPGLFHHGAAPERSTQAEQAFIDDLRLSKRALIDNLVELDNLPESSFLEYESPLFENLEKRESMLRLSKRDLLRLSKRDFLRLTKKSEDSSNRDLRLSKRPEWSEVEWHPPLLDKKDAPAKVPMIIRLSKRDLSRLLNEGSLGGDAAELRLANRLSKRTFETVN